MLRTTETILTTLPTIVERPHGEVVIFDGHCRFCLAQMKRLKAMDTRGRLAFVSLHDPVVAERWPNLSHDELMSRIYVIDARGHQHGGAAAFRYLSRKLPWLWWLAPIMHIPGSLPLWQFLYQHVARIRYQFGRTDACEQGSCDLHFKRK